MNGEDEAAIDPRRVRSRNRLLDASVALLKSGGLEAVTVEGVTKLSKVAKTTLYRHFDNAVQLRAATIERLLPPVLETPPPGPLRDRLIALLERQADAIHDAPLQISTLAWLATGAERGADSPELTSLSRRLIDQYRVPFDLVLDTAEARAQLGDFDIFFALSQLVGPLVFTKLIGLGAPTHAQCAQIVDDFLAARAAARTVAESDAGHPRIPGFAAG
ncbi:TetR/AcrR family transcriptional regulator [Nocardia bovistercoris]|uniref:TetR/AcrR family transcriptional regulator n=1 Tax=Nocardia bovistercoris TaxID=2785916 RepID=A0A931N6L5_9NOCA|nr:TetR/AcrR family transcriptional regulator [Nocardia bovistercoris]MBH0779813.1 TetR/AcrR family transcriptional regulator [Nocardia bovistercoris]